MAVGTRQQESKYKRAVGTNQTPASKSQQSAMRFAFLASALIGVNLRLIFSHALRYA